MKTSFALAIVASVAPYAVAVPDCGDGGAISILGSSTVYPVSVAWAGDYNKTCTNNKFNVSSGGSGAGAKSVCGATLPAADIGNMSRDWNTTSEASTTDSKTFTCLVGDTTRQVVQIPVAVDGIVVFVGKSNKIWTDCLQSISAGLASATELRWLYSSTSQYNPIFGDNDPTTHYWNEICGNTKLPANTSVSIYAPDVIYGTHDFFKSVIFTAAGEDFRTGVKYYADNSNALRDAVLADQYGIGFLGYSYFSKNNVTMQSIKIDGIEPTDATLYSDSYLPLGRRIYSNFFVGALKKTACFAHFGLSDAGSLLTDSTGFLPIPSEEFPGLLARVGKCGNGTYAPTAAPTDYVPACSKFCWFFTSPTSCCNKRRASKGKCACK